VLGEDRAVGLLVAFGSPFVGRLIDRYGTPRLLISSNLLLNLVLLPNRRGARPVAA